jgi:hypothetical protein
MSEDAELIELVKAAMILYNPNDDMASLAIAAVRAYDREQRAKIDAWLAPKTDVIWFTYQTASQKKVVGPDGIERFTSEDLKADPDDDREQRAKIDAALAPKGDPDDYRDLHFVTRMDRAPGIREG